MKINNKVYDVLKYLAVVGLPALATFVFTLGPIWEMSHVDQVAKTIVAVNTLLGALILVNQVRYNNSEAKYDGFIDPVTANSQTSTTALALKGDEYDVMNQKDVLLRVKQHDPII